MRSFTTLLLFACVAGRAQTSDAPVLTLDDAIAMALKSNKQVQITSLDITRATEATAEIRTSRLPQFKTYILGGSTLSPLHFTIPAGALGLYPSIGPIPAKDSDITTPPRLTALVFGSAAQPVSQLYKIRLGIRESKLGEELAHENLRQQRQDTAHQVREAYYDLVQTQSQIAAAEAALKYLEELSALTARRFAEQAVLKSDTLNVKAKLSQQRYQLLTLRDAFDTRREALNRLLGRDLQTSFTVQLQPSPSFDELDLARARTRALDQRPEIRKARLQIAKSELDIRREKAEYLPNVSVQFSYLSLANVNFAPQNIAHAGFLLDWQPFDWGQKRHRIEQRKAAARQAVLTREDAEQQVLLDVNAKYRKLLESRALMDTQAAVQETEREQLRVVMNRYEQKSALLAGVLEQQASVAQADNQYQQALAGFWTAKAAFDRALGEE